MKGFPDELLLGKCNDQTIPPGYYDFLNNNDDNDKNTPGTPVDDVFPDNKGVKYSVVQNAPDDDDNDEDNDVDTEDDDADSDI